MAVRPVADHGWWVAGAEAVLTSACATLSRDAASGGITDMFFFSLLQNISSFSLWAYRFTIILYEHMLIITRKGPSYLLHSRPQCLHHDVIRKSKRRVAPEGTVRRSRAAAILNRTRPVSPMPANDVSAALWDLDHVGGCIT